MARGFAAEFTLEHPAFVVGLIAAIGALVWWRKRSQGSVLGTPNDPNGAFFGSNQSNYDASFNGLLGADTAWNIVQAKGAIAGLYPFSPMAPASQSGILYPMTPFP